MNVITVVVNDEDVNFEAFYNEEVHMLVIKYWVFDRPFKGKLGIKVRQMREMVIGDIEIGVIELFIGMTVSLIERDMFYLVIRSR